MAIVQMSKITLGVPSRLGDDALKLLQGLNLLHIRRIGETGENSPVENDSTTFLELDRAKKALENIDRLLPEKLPFIANFSWPRPRLSKQEYENLQSSIDLKKFTKDLLGLTRRYDKIRDQRSKLNSERQLLTRYKFVPVPTKLDDTKSISFILGQIPRRNMGKALILDKEEDCAVERFGADVILVCLKHEKVVEVKTKLSKLGFESLPIPLSPLTPKEQIQNIDQEIENLNGEQKDILEKIKEKYLPHRLALLSHIDRLELKIESERIRNLALDSEHAVVFVGYLPTKNSEIFRKKIKQKIQSSYLLVEDIPDTEEAPVTLSNNGYSRQFEMLTSMYGLPGYRGIDSTFVVSIIFPIFFGLCFGDVLYGFMLMGFSLWFGRIYKHEESARKFFGTFLISSIFVIVVGFLTGAWGGDLVGAESIISWQPLVNLREALMVIDPIKETIPFFVLTLYIGIGIQFLGIIYKGWMQIKNGEWLYAITDSGGWIIFLSGLTLFAIDFLKPGGISATMTTVMYILLAVGAAFLIFSQGKGTKSVVGRVGVGVMSLYGVLGGYGTTGFLSDVMSYSRLLALGLTTSIVGLAFNSIAEMMGLTGFGLFFAILILFVGHLFNFFLNIVGSFVHPARLVFLEFYSRFYESGGGKYRPFSNKRHTRINVIEEGA